MRARRFRTHLGRITGGALVILVGAFLTLPSLVVLLSSINPTTVLNFPPQGFSLRWYRELAERPDFRLGLLNTLEIAAASTGLSLALGTAASLRLYRAAGTATHWIRAGLLSPLVLPGVLIGVGLLLFASQVGLVASFTILVLGHTLMVLPFVLQSLWTSLENLDPNLERAAATLGARPAQVFRYVTLPLLRPGLLAGALFAAMISINEFAVSLFVVGRRTQTLPVVLFNYTLAYVDPSIAAVSSLFILATAVAVMILERTVGLRRLLRLEPGP